jgi:hypothetical protein
MSENPRAEIERQDRLNGKSSDESNKGPSLTLMYGLIALALAAAIVIAVLIVRPFYLRR